MQLAALFCLLATAVATSPQVNFPLSLQFPPVARVGEAYSFQFASTTFQPNPDELVYSIAYGPSWLHIHGENRTIWGTPDAKDVGVATFTIAAAGEAGVVANMESKLPVENSDGPEANGNISQALSKAGQLSGPRSVTLLPSKPFEIVFGRDLFKAKGRSLTYHTTLADHTPLPGWISFDAQSLRFAGTTPPAASPQVFQVLLIASDTPDYATASISFTLVVSNHLLLFKPMTQNMNVSKGEHVEIKGLKGLLFLDNAPIRIEDIQSASADLPSWLSFDTGSLDISGIPPSGLMSQDISVTVEDKFGDSAKHSIHLAFSSQLFTGEVGKLNLTAGVYFEHQIPKSILAQENEKVSLEFGKLNKWLSFDPESLTVKGTLPDDTAACLIEGSMTATSPDGKTRDTQTFQIDVLGNRSTGSNNSSTTNTSSNKDEGDGIANTDAGLTQRKKAGIIVGSVLSGIFAAAILLAFIFFLCRRKKHEKGYISPAIPRSPRKTDISRPIPIVAGWEDIDKADDADLEKGKLDDSPLQTSERPPQRKSYIRKRASAQSPFFGGNSRVSSSSYKSPPDFIGDSSPATKSPLAPISPNILRFSDSVPNENKMERAIPESLLIRKPADTPSPVTYRTDYSRSLRKHRPTRAFLRRNTEGSLVTDNDRAENSSARPETIVYSPPSLDPGKSMYGNLRGAGLKMNLNKMTGEPIFTDEEMSESNYSGEENDIEEAEKRATLKPSNSIKYAIGPLKFEKKEQNQKRESKRSSKRNSKRELKRTSERDPTPYRAFEHGGKENHSSTYSLHHPPSPRIPSDDRERHSRKSIHSRQQSRLSLTAPKKRRDRSRTQSGAYPHLNDTSALMQEINKATEGTHRRPRGDTAESKTERDGAGNVVGYGEGEAPKIEELGKQSIGVRTSNGHVSAGARYSKLAQLHTSPFYHSKRETVIPSSSTPTQTHYEGLGLSIDVLDGEDKTLRPESAREGRERTPLSVLDDGNRGTPERVRVTEGKGSGWLVGRLTRNGREGRIGSLRGCWGGAG
ncbi:polarity establishment/cellular polarization [Kalmusia sp. IMI 367209]|nr:polarity establishment/cellular polarization [Kalmusia sp. IMI 367209]